MPELIEEQDSIQPDFDRYIDVVRRRHMYFLVPAFLGWLLVWGSSWVLPSSYKSSTQILVEQPTMPENYVAPNVNENLQDRMQSITQQIMSRTRLLIIINKLGLYANSDLKTPDDKVDRMRKDIGPVELVRDVRNNEITAFRISFSSRDPLLAQKVTSELTQLFIDENNRVRQQQSQGTTNFIEQQLEDARVQLAAQEAKMKQFEAAHEGALPSQQASNLQILSGLQGQLQNQQDALNTAKQQRVYYQTLIEQYKSLHAAGKSVDGQEPTEVTALDNELTRLRSQLTDLSSRYTDSYPDVQKVKAQIAKTEKQKADLLAAPRVPGKQRETESAPLLQLQSQLEANQVEIAGRERGIAGLEGRINEYQGRLNLEPATEQELLEVSRGYEQSKANYDDLLKKKNNSVMATSMEQLQQGERFTILDPPSLPVKPDYPNRLKFCGFGIGAGLGLGCLVLLVLELFDDRMHGEKELKALLPVKVMAEIPEIDHPGDKETQKRRIAMGWATAAVIVVVIAVGSAVSYLRG